MGKETTVPWTDRTFNGWWGCVEVSPACRGCYAREWAKFTGFKEIWGKDGPRRLFGDKHWAEPLKWEAEAVAAGKRLRVFCLSMGDFFEDHPALLLPRLRLLQLITQTPHLDWLILTKRPGDALRLLRQTICIPSSVDQFDAAISMVSNWIAMDQPPANLWLGATVEDNERLKLRAGELIRVPAVVHFLSMEPLLEWVDPSRYFTCGCLEERFAGTQSTHEPLDLPDGVDCCDFCGRPIAGVDWVIVGGESNQGKYKGRDFELAWPRRILEKARTPASVFSDGSRHPAFFMKQGGARTLLPLEELGGWLKTQGRKDKEVKQILVPAGDGKWRRWSHAEGEPPAEAVALLPLKDRKGENIAELPEDLRVREWPRRAV